MKATSKAAKAEKNGTIDAAEARMTGSVAEKANPTKSISITEADIRTLAFKITGDAPLVMCKFSEKARLMMEQTQKEGSTAKSRKNRAPKDFEELFHAAMHKSTDGWYGIPCAAFRNGMVSACRVAGFAMTKAKLTVKVVADGFGEDGTPLVKITKGTPKMHSMHARPQLGVVDIRVRGMWDPGWTATVTVEYDASMLRDEDVTNLMNRLGRQVGILEGRPDSKNSAGMGWGTFLLSRSAQIS